MALRTSTRSSNRGQRSERPALPMDKYNEMLSATVEGSESPPVKFQPIKKEGHTIIVGRVKVPTPAGHAYVLRRYDTGSISLTTMWKAAFPNASTVAEKDETNWVKKHFNISGPAETIRLAGTWLPVPIAQQLGAEYRLTKTVEGLSKAEPDHDTVLRSHENGMPDTPNVPPSKRRKAASPKSPEKKPMSSSGRTTRSSGDPGVATASPRVSVGRQLRSNTKSPAPAARSTPSRAVKSKIMTPPAEKDDPLVAAAADSESQLTSVNPDTDIAESKALVDKVKAEHNTPGLKTATPAKLLPKRGAAAKRAREEAEDILPNGKTLIKMDLDAEPADPNVDREIASNRRIVKWRQSLPSLPTLPRLEPEQKSAAWGTLAFALAIGATTYIPQFF